MNLIEIDKDFNVIINPMLYTIKAFKAIIARDKTKHKTKALAEIAFIYFFANIKSDYMYIIDVDERIKEIRNDVDGLSSDWVPDDVVMEAIRVYKERSTTLLTTLYESSCKAASDVSKFLDKTDELLEERDDNGKPIYDISKITTALQKIPVIMRNLKQAHHELVREQQDAEGRSSGSKEFNMFEDGLEL